MPMDPHDPGWRPENWYRERKLFPTLWRRVNLPARKLLYMGEVRRLASLRRQYAGQRVFLAGNAPSLSKLDLSRLSDDMVCVVNRGLRALDEGLCHGQTFT